MNTNPINPMQSALWLADKAPDAAVSAWRYFNEDEQPQEQSNTRDWNAPSLSRPGALSQDYGDYKATPYSPSVGQSGHFEFYDYPATGQDNTQIPYRRDADFGIPTAGVDEVENPDSREDPGGYASSTLHNRAVVGHGFGVRKRPELPKMGQVMDKALEEEGKQVMFDQSKVPVWYESDAFSSSLISFGLNLLAGNDIATAFNQAGGVFDKGYSREKRMAWAQDLADQGYDAHEIQAWIETGDHKALSDPMEKKMRMQSYRLGQAQLNKALYESSPEYQEYLREMEGYKMDMDERKFEADIGYKNAMLGMQSQELALKQKEFDQKVKAAAAGKPDKVSARDALLAVQQLSTDLNLANQRVPTAGGVIASGAKWALGDEAGLHMLNSPLVAGNMPETAQANKIRLAQDQFTENAVRLATGAVVKAEEQEKFRNYLFPQGNEFNNPQIVTRKRALQDVFNVVASNIAQGKTREFDTASMLKISDDVSKGNAQVLKRDGVAVGLLYKNGKVLQF